MLKITNNSHNTLGITVGNVEIGSSLHTFRLDVALREIARSSGGDRDVKKFVEAVREQLQAHKGNSDPESSGEPFTVHYDLDRLDPDYHSKVHRLAEAAVAIAMVNSNQTPDNTYAQRVMDARRADAILDGQAQMSSFTNIPKPKN